ncbi:unnamed protein product [Cylindrotheca closterium]|uniref:PDZ domain-containing protein n=1 Tax=Cylindrotheca closterium TaxID=2856 RepID=A0AAD2FMA0_9STRA|nr:unnamed protein product [Cylindrotheca closterium]
MVKQTKGKVTKLQVCLHKPTKESVLGIGFCREDEDDDLTISGIAEDGLVFQQTQLKPGLKMLQINGLDVQKADPVEIATILKEAPPGNITFLVKGQGLEHVKDAVSYQTGLTFREVQGVKGIMIAGIENESMFAYNELEVGSLLQSINVEVKPTTSEGAMRAMDVALPGKVTVKAERMVQTNLGIWADRRHKPEQQPVEEKKTQEMTVQKVGVGQYMDSQLVLDGAEEDMTETVVKPTADADMGLIFEQRGRDVIISKIVGGTPFSYSPIQPGMRLESITYTNEVATAKDAAFTLDRLTMIDGVEMALDAEAFVATTHKTFQWTSTGLKLMDSDDGVIIHEIPHGSHFDKTDLKVGMKILSVNGRPCPFTAYQVVDQIKKATGKIKIVAQFPLSYVEVYKQAKAREREIETHKDAFFLCGETPSLFSG